jgi:hypothetical protein
MWHDDIRARLTSKAKTARQQYIDLLRKAATSSDLSDADKRQLEKICVELGTDPQKLEEHARALAEHSAATEKAKGILAAEAEWLQIVAEEKDITEDLIEFCRKNHQRSVDAMNRRHVVWSKLIELRGNRARATVIEESFPELFIT